MAELILHGEPGHPSETLAAEYLAEKLPAPYQVHYALKMGYEQTDFDCIVVAPHAVYAIEIKAYGETIIFDPKDSKWVLSSGERKPAATGQAATNRSKLHTLLQEYYIGFKDVPVQEVVCLYAENKPNVSRFPENQRRLTFWYKDLPDYLKDRERLTRRSLGFDLTDYMDIIKHGLAFGLGHPRYLNDYKIESCVWITSQYRGYAASSSNWPYQHILKVYDFPNDISEGTVQKFIDDLKRERDALKRIADMGDPASGGQQNVMLASNAFYNKSKNQYAVVMNAVHGEPLSVLMKHSDKWPRAERFQLAAQVCRGLQFVHSADVIHRGLHPENIIRDKDGVAKLVNFNFAKFSPLSLPKNASSTMRADNFVLNRWIKEGEKTHRYMAPELFSENEGQTSPQATLYTRATRETDLYSLGVILWELFAEESYPGPQAESLDKRSNLPIELAAPLKRMLAADAQERKKVDLLDVAEKFEFLANGEPLDNRSLPLLKPGYDFDGFKIQKELATTLMSRTYLAKDKFGDGQVVIKFLRASSPGELLDEMQRTWNILWNLDPAYTARLKDGGRKWVRNGIAQKEKVKDAIQVYYQVFEFLPGKTLRELIQEGSIRSDRAMLHKVILGLLDALRSVHAIDWIHQDIKPDNVILTEDGRVKIIDFGLSRRVNAESVSEAYSPGYTPPEARRSAPDVPGQAWTQAGDVYSAAHVILALISGEPELKGPVLNPEQVLKVGGLAFLELLQRDTSNDPSDRLPNGIQMAVQYKQALQNFQASEGKMDDRIHILPPSPEEESQEEPGTMIVMAENEETLINEPQPEDADWAKQLELDEKQRQQAQRIEQLNQQTQAELEKMRQGRLANRALITSSIQELRRYDPNSADALELEKALAAHEIKAELQGLKNKLKIESDLGPLEDAIKQAEQSIQEGKFDDELTEYFAQAQQRRKEIKDRQNKLSTLAADKDYHAAKNLLTDINDEAKAGHTTYFDLGAGGPILIVDARVNASQLIQKHAGDAIVLAEQHAHNVLEAGDGFRSPQTALAWLQAKLLEYGDDLSDETKQRLGALCAGWEAELEQWKTAEAKWQAAAQTADTIARLDIAYAARQAYPYHKGAQKFPEYFEAACVTFAEKLKEAIRQAEILVAKAPQEAEERRHQSQDARGLACFAEARQVVKQVLAEIEKHLQEKPADELGEQVSLAQKFLSDVDKAEARRDEIASHYDQIRVFIDQNAKQQVLNAYDALPKDFKDDAEIRCLREQMDKFFDVDKLMQELRGLYRDAPLSGESIWRDCLALCKKIDEKPQAEREPFLAQLEWMRYVANLNLYRIQIQSDWCNQDYREALKHMRLLETCQPPASGPAFSEADPREEVKESLGWDGKRKELAERAAMNNQQDIPAQEKTAREALKKFKGMLAQLGENERIGQEDVTQAFRLYYRLADLEKVKSLQERDVKELAGRMRWVLRNLLLHEVRWQHKKCKNAQGEQDLTQAYEYVDFLSKNQLLYPEDIPLWREVVEGHFTHQAEGAGGFAQKAGVWADAYQKHPLPFISMHYRQAQARYLADEIDKCVRTKDYPRAQKLLNRQEILPVCQNLSEDDYDAPVLQARKAFVRALNFNANLESPRGYFEQVERYKNGLEAIKSFPPEALAGLAGLAERQRSEFINTTVESLVTQWRQLGNVMFYVHAAALAPGHGLVQSSLKNNTESIKEKAKLIYDEAASAKENIGATDLPGKIETLRILARDLESLSIACQLIGEKDLANKLDDARDQKADNVRSLVDKLVECQKIAQEIAPESWRWKEKCLRQGEWSEARQKLNQLRASILGANHEAVTELAYRIEINETKRLHLSELKESIRKALREEEFATGLEKHDELKEAMHENLGLHGIALPTPPEPPSDPYYIIEKHSYEPYYFASIAMRLYYFAQPGTDPANTLTLAQFFKTRKKNLEEWESTHEKVKAQKELLVPAGGLASVRPQVNGYLTRRRLEEVEKYIAKCAQFFEQCSGWLDGHEKPLSKKAEKLKKQVEELTQSVQKEYEAAQADLKLLEEKEKEIQDEINLALDALNRNEDDSALIHINSAVDFYQDSEGNPQREFAVHIKDVLQVPVQAETSGKNWLGSLFQRS